jgi:spore maturation protein CgeB
MHNSRPSIAVFGSSLVSTYRNGAATYYRGIFKYLGRLGYKITFYEPDAFERQMHVDLDDPGRIESVVYRNDLLSVERALDNARESDVLIKVSGVGVFDEYLENALPGIKKSHQLAIFWDIAPPATLRAVFDIPNTTFRHLIPQYDYIFTSGGGQPLIDTYKSLGAKACVPVYNALDPETHFRVSPEPRYRCDLAFMGNRVHDREERFQEFFVDVARQMPDKKFILAGSGWDHSALPGNVTYFGHLYSHEHNVFNSSPLAVLNISRRGMADYSFSAPARVFEAAGAGACIITDNWNGIHHFFEPVNEILVARTGSEVRHMLEQLDELKAEKTGLAAFARVIADNTCEKRAMQVSNILLEKRSFTTNPSLF